MVRTFDVKTDAIKFSRRISVPDDLGWLTRTIVWATNNGHGVEIFNEEDEGTVNG